VVKKMLQSIPKSLEQVAIFMETLLDLDSLSILEAVGHLQVVDNHKKKKSMWAGKDAGGQLLLIEEQWRAQSKSYSGEKSGGRGGGGNGDGGCGGHGCGCGRGGSGGPNDAQSESLEKREDAGGSDGPAVKCCFRCGKPDHFTASVGQKRSWVKPTWPRKRNPH
jgi:hypothetical protein